jgi:hypothetical protein
MKALVALLLWLLLGAAAPVSLISALSQSRIDINTTFKGADLLVFGAIQYPAGAVPDAPPDIAIVVRGPAAPVTVTAGTLAINGAGANAGLGGISLGAAGTLDITGNASVANTLQLTNGATLRSSVGNGTLAGGGSTTCCSSSAISVTVPICWAFCLSASRVTLFTTSLSSGWRSHSFFSSASVARPWARVMAMTLRPAMTTSVEAPRART